MNQRTQENNRTTYAYENHHDEENNNFSVNEVFIPDEGPHVVRRYFKTWSRTHYIQLGVMSVLILIIFLLPLLDQVAQNALQKLNAEIRQRDVICPDACSFSLVESIPEGMIYPNGTTQHPSTFETWKNLIENAESSIEIGSFYWTMRGDDVIPHPSAAQGEEIFNALLEAGTKRGIKIKIAQSQPSSVSPGIDTQILMDKGAADVRSVNFNELLGAGVLHTKLWIVDGKNFYVGSANMDWRSLTQVKEMGIVARNCSCLANDIRKIFKVYWMLGTSGATIPKHWDPSLDTNYNLNNPVTIVDPEDFTYLSYVSSSPLPLCPDGRTNDIDAIVRTIQGAKKFIYIAVMDYFPLTIYTRNVHFWPVIDDALRTAAINNRVQVKMLISQWNHSRSSEDYFLKSLASLSGPYYPLASIDIRRFVVPATPDQEKIPFARVNHNKYMVTDTVAYIGTSNWAADYFINTAGVGVVLLDDQADDHAGIRSELQAVFERDWNSNYSHPLN